jgi:hypothetical protein
MTMSLPSISVLVLGIASILLAGANAQIQDQLAGIRGNPLQAQSLDSLSATRNRPLFTPDRRPPAPPPPPAAPEPMAPPAPPDVTLLGIVVAREGARAIVRSGTAKIERVQIGDDISGWKVSQIEARRLLLSLDGRLAAFTLFSRGSGRRPADDPTPQAADKPRDQSQQYGMRQTTSPAAEAPQAASRRRR